MSDHDFKSVGAMEFASTRSATRQSKILHLAFQVEVTDAVAFHLLSKDFDWDEFFTQLKASPEWFMTGIERWQKRYEETIDNQETALVTLSAKNDTVTAENEWLRAALAMSELPCVYCTLPSEEMSKCKRGFPGCARADDAVGCPHFGAGLELSTVTAERDTAKEIIKELVREVEIIEEIECFSILEENLLARAKELLK